MRLHTRIAALALGAAVAWMVGAVAAFASGPVIVDDGNGGFTGSIHKEYPPSKGTPKPTPVESGPSKDTSLDYLDPAIRDQIAKCLRETHDDLCYEGLIGSLDVPAVAREVVARLHLPDPTPQFGPDPEANQWHMLAVGYPLWLWTSGPTRLTTTASRYGLSFTLTATWESTRFEFGDGQSLTCTKTTPYSPTTVPGAPSPTCGYVYQQASPASGYTVRAHTNWRVDWAASGQSGTIDTTYSGARTVPVGELNALIVK